MRKRVIFSGVGTALITPFIDTGIDFDSLRRIIDFQIEAGVDALVIAGTTGEASTLSEDERYSLYEFARSYTAGRVPLILGTGTNDTKTATRHTRRAAEIGADAILMAKNIDYLYTADPRKDPTATPIYDVTYDEILEKNLRAFDMSAVIFCKDNNIESYGFGLADPENIYRAVMGEPVGTRMHN